VEFVMRKSGWTPSIVPTGDDPTVYLVVDDLGRLGRVWREADYERTDLETVIQDLLAGEYSNPIGVFGFNPWEGWSRDVSADVAQALRPATARRAGQHRGFCRKAREPRRAATNHAAGLSRGVPAKEACRNRDQGALPRLHLNRRWRPRSTKCPAASAGRTYELGLGSSFSGCGRRHRPGVRAPRRGLFARVLRSEGLWLT
jgi:hypothetical protein